MPKASAAFTAFTALLSVLYIFIEFLKLIKTTFAANKSGLNTKNPDIFNLKFIHAI